MSVIAVERKAKNVGCLPNAVAVIWLQCAFYFLAAFLGFFVCIPIGIVLRNFQGSCILFAQLVRWGTAIIWPWSETSCDYVLFMNLAVNIFYATFMGFLCLTVGLRRTYTNRGRLGSLQEWHISFVLNAFNPIFVVINCLIAVLEIAGAGIVIAGTAQFCKFTMDYMHQPPPSVLSKATMPPRPFNGSMPTSCSGLSTWDGWKEVRIVRGRDHGVDGHNAYGCLILACIASVLLMIVWVMQFAMNVGASCRVCSCEVAEEKQKNMSRTAQIAARRSRLATPISTPGARSGQPGSQPVTPGQRTPMLPPEDDFPMQKLGPSRPFQPQQQRQQPGRPHEMEMGFMGKPHQMEYPDDYQAPPLEKKGPPPSDSSMETPTKRDFSDDSQQDSSRFGASPQPHQMAPPPTRMAVTPRTPAVSPPPQAFPPPPKYSELPIFQGRTPIGKK